MDADAPESNLESQEAEQRFACACIRQQKGLHLQSSQRERLVLERPSVVVRT